MDIDRLIQRLQEIKAQHGGEIDVGFKKGDRFPYFDESMFADVKYIDSSFKFVNEFQPFNKAVVVIG